MVPPSPFLVKAVSRSCGWAASCVRNRFSRRVQPAYILRLGWMTVQPCSFGGGWAKPIQLPTDSANAAILAPQVVNGTIESIVPGPAGQVLLGGSFTSTILWNIRKNTMEQIDVVRKEQ